MKNPFMNIDENTRKSRALKAERLKANPEIQKLLSGCENPEAMLENNLEVLSSWLDEKERCFHCQGLAFCPKAKDGIGGHNLDLQIDDDGQIVQVLRSCRYQRERDEKSAHLKKIWINHMDQDVLLLDLESVNPAREDGISYIQSYMSLLGSLNTDYGVYLFGQAGVGKSFLLSRLANTCAKKGKSVCFVRVPRLISEIKDHFSDDAFRRETLWNLTHCDVLVLDDIGSEASSAWARDDILFFVLDERLNHHRKTYFSSNLSMDELAGQYISAREHNSEVAVSRLLDRIRTLAMPCLLQGESRRKAPCLQSRK